MKINTPGAMLDNARQPFRKWSAVEWITNNWNRNLKVLPSTNRVNSNSVLF